MTSRTVLFLSALAVACGSKAESHSTAGTSTVDLGPARAPLPPAPPSLASGLGPAERARFYHQPIGTETLALAFLRALDSSASHRPFIDGLERFGLLADPDPTNLEQLPVGVSLQPADAQHPLAMIGLTCSACHVGEIHHHGQALRIDGAPSAFDVHAFFSEALASVRATLEWPADTLEFVRRFRTAAGVSDMAPIQAAILAATCPGCDEDEVDRRLGDQIAWLAPRPARPELQSEIARSPEGKEALAKTRRSLQDGVFVLEAYFLHLQQLADRPAPSSPGPGRCDAYAAARDLLARPGARSPLDGISDIPALWGNTAPSWLGRSGDIASPLARDVAVALASGAAWDPSTLASTVRPREIAEADMLVEKIASPPWPEDLLGTIDRARAKHGKRVFRRECASCHGASPASGAPRTASTDPLRAILFAGKIGDRPVAEALGAALGRLAAKAGAARSGSSDGEGALAWRATGRYVARPLTGVWVTAPYLHNGSVPSLYDLLQPAARRPRIFEVSREYDPTRLGFAIAAPRDARARANEPPAFLFDASLEGNSNAGHEFGTKLSDTEKRDLIEYLKTL